jgi:hypothetical protein
MVKRALKKILLRSSSLGRSILYVQVGMLLPRQNGHRPRFRFSADLHVSLVCLSVSWFGAEINRSAELPR